MWDEVISLIFLELFLIQKGGMACGDFLEFLELFFSRER
jgi:hypothetical protein